VFKPTVTLTGRRTNVMGSGSEIARKGHTRLMRTRFLIIACLLPGNVGLSSPADAQDRPYIFGSGMYWAKWLQVPWSFDGDAMDRLVEAGATITFLSFEWQEIEHVRGSYNWEYSDSEVYLAEARGLEMLASIATTPVWALPPEADPTQTHRFPPDETYLEDFRSYCRNVAARYAGRVRYFQFWNEPNGCGWINDGCANSNEYASFTLWLTRCYEAMKQGNPDCIIAAGGLDASTAVANIGDYLQGLYDSGGGSSFDAVAIHPYDVSGTLHWDAIAQTRAVMVANGDARKPIWLTEYGWQTPPLSEQERAERLSQVLNELKRPEYQYIPIAVYLNVIDPFGAEGFGLCGQDLTPRSIWYAFRDADKTFFDGVPPVQADAATLVLQSGRRLPDGTDYDGVRDAHLVEAQPTNNTGGGTLLEAGRVQGASENGDRGIVVKFDGFDLARAQESFLKKAVLALSVAGTRNDPPGEQVKTLLLRRLYHDWGEGAGTGLDGQPANAGEVTWDSPLGPGAGDNPCWDGTLLAGMADPTTLDAQAVSDTAYGKVYFDVTRSVRDHLRLPVNIFGFTIHETPGSESLEDGTRQFYSSQFGSPQVPEDVLRRPALLLTFVPPPPADLDNPSFESNGGALDDWQMRTLATQGADNPAQSNGMFSVFTSHGTRWAGKISSLLSFDFRIGQVVGVEGFDPASVVFDWSLGALVHLYSHDGDSPAPGNVHQLWEVGWNDDGTEPAHMDAADHYHTIAAFDGDFTGNDPNGFHPLEAGGTITGVRGLRGVALRVQLWSDSHLLWNMSNIDNVQFQVTARASIPGDFDDDEDVDQDDADAFEPCSSASAVTPPPGCESKDLDSDGDVDQSDFGIFQRCISGEDITGDPNCAE